MHIAYLVVTIVFASIVTFSGIGKIRRDPHQVRVIHETVGVPLKFFPLLAACEFAGALGLLAGIVWLLFATHTTISVPDRRRWSRPLFRGRRRVACACRRFQGHWSPRLHADASGGSADSAIFSITPPIW